jgi:hypothetical protein
MPQGERTSTCSVFQGFQPPRDRGAARSSVTTCHKPLKTADSKRARPVLEPCPLLDGANELNGTETVTAFAANLSGAGFTVNPFATSTTPTAPRGLKMTLWKFT